MPGSLSRFKLADHTAASLKSGDPRALQRLAAYLIDTKRQDESELIVRDIEQALVGRGIVLADVTAARQLNTDSRQTIEGFITKDTGATEVILREHIDSQVIGGVRVTYGDRLLDATVASKLDRLAQKGI